MPGSACVLRKAKVCSRAARRRFASSSCADRQEREVWQILFTREFGRVRGHRVRVQLLRDVRLDRVEPQRRRGDAGEREHVLRDDDLRARRIGSPNATSTPKGLPVELARELALGAEPKPVVLHPVVLDLRVVVVRPDLERHEVAEVLATGLLHHFASTSSGEPTMRRSTSFVVRARSRRSSRTSPPFSVAASPSTATIRAEEAIEDESWRLRANSAPVLADERRRCSSAA